MEPSIVAFRAWRVLHLDNNPKLASLWDLGNPQIWSTSFTAQCSQKIPHKAPQMGCYCGIYALNKPEECLNGLVDTLGAHTLCPQKELNNNLVQTYGRTFVFGAVQLTGSIIEHENGYRAVKARVLAISIAPAS